MNESGYKVLMCSQTVLKKELGGSKPLIELAEELPALGWECTLLCPADLREQADIPGKARSNFADHLRCYLQRHAGEYDVVDYDHEYLPFPRHEFAPETLFVARSVLLVHHLETIAIPTGRRLKSRVGAILKVFARRRERARRVRNAHTTVLNADLVNVSNKDDEAELIRRGISPSKIAVLPFGISEARRRLFDAVSTVVPKQPMVAFVGTFDYRKGAAEFPRLVELISAANPDVRFRLMGTAGMFPTKEAVLAHFPESALSSLEVIPRYKPEELAGLLADCSVGVFPSHLEGFGFGVLEMLAASVPVVAYNSPGPPMMLARDFLVPRGDVAAMSERVSALLCSPARLQKARLQAKVRSQAFTWKGIAQETSDIYLHHLHRKRGRSGGVESSLAIS